jgi:phosphosulfolactate phosphohydrolase-like enzyme
VVLTAAVHVVAAVMAVLAAVVLIVAVLTAEAHTVVALTEVDMVVVDNKSKNILGELKMLRGDVQI